MADGITVDNARYDATVLRLAMTSRKPVVEVGRQQAKLVFGLVAKHTPPASQGVTGRAAEKQGQGRVEYDLRGIYGTPGDAYDEIAADSPAAASSFWFLNEAGEVDAARAIFDATAGDGRPYAPFDGGAIQQAAIQKQGGRLYRRKKKRYFVSDPDNLSAYIEEEQSHVWWLASAWKQALTALGAKLPYGVDKQNAPGSLLVDVTDRLISITMTNEVAFAANVKDIQRRIDWAMTLQTLKLDRQWEFYLSRAAREAGFSKS